jgi:Zn-dependent protease with chaperone function
VLEHEAGINAFAAGYSTSDAVIAVTRGALDSLNRDELQGVIAHEFSHILNGDMRLNIRLIGVLFGILMIGLIGARSWSTARFGGRGKGIGAILVAPRWWRCWSATSGCSSGG